MNKYFIGLLIIISFSPFHYSQIQSENPRVAIIISKTSYNQNWGVIQMSAHGWGGVANLAGIPYDCLFIEDLTLKDNLEKYECLILSQCTYLADSTYNSFIGLLDRYLSNGGNLILDGLIGFFDDSTRERNHTELDKILDVEYTGFYGTPDFRIKTFDNTHFITRKFKKGEFVSQHLAGGLNIQKFRKEGRVLLELSDERDSYPFLSANMKQGSRIVLINDFATWSGAASIFRNIHPQVFYPNNIYDILIESVYWTLYGHLKEPFPSLQLSNADLTAIIRLDADASGNLNAQVQTINYLIDIAKESGVVPVYAWVSSTAASAGWQDIAPLGKRLESIGGQIGTHSKFHNIDQEMNDKRWKEELDDAIRDIEFNMSDYGYDIGKVNCFINPGNTIHMSDYNQVAKRFGLYMTHGFEQDMPIGYGNFSWFTEGISDFVVLENTPSPDYQWFYDPTWSYTTQQITAYQENIFDHLYNNIQRGVVYNQMWHDYSITSQPQYGKDRVVNKSNIAMYDALKSKFMNSNIYCPEPDDIRYKMVIMAQSNYSWQTKDDEITFKLDISDIDLDSAYLFTGGMGIRINNSLKKINQVFINDAEYFAFSNDVVILPNLSGTSAEIRILLSETSNEPHLNYISKRMPGISKKNDELIFKVLTKSKAKFSLVAPENYLLLNADGFSYNLNQVEGYATSDGEVRLKKLESGDILFLSSTVRILNVTESDNKIALLLKNNDVKKASELKLSSSKNIQISIDGKKITPHLENEIYTVRIDPFDGEQELIISFYGTNWKPNTDWGHWILGHKSDLDFLKENNMTVTFGTGAPNFDEVSRTEFNLKMEEAKKSNQFYHDNGFIVLRYLSTSLNGNSNSNKDIPKKNQINYLSFYNERWNDFKDYIGPKPTEDPTNWMMVRKDGSFPYYRYAPYGEETDSGFEAWGVPVNPDYIKMMEGKIRAQAETGIDGSYIDWTHIAEETSYDKYSYNGFIQYLKKNLPLDVSIKKYGIGDYSNLELPAKSGDKFWMEWITYRGYQVAEFHKHIRATARKYNPHFMISGNVFGGFGFGPIAYLSGGNMEMLGQDGYDDFIYSEMQEYLDSAPRNNNGVKITNSPALKFLTAASHGKPVIIYATEITPPIFPNPTEKCLSSMAQINIAEAVANHCIFREKRETPQGATDIYKFLSENRQYLIGSKLYSNIGILASLNQFLADEQSYAFSTSRVLTDNGINHIFIVEKDLSDNLLSQLDLIILPYLPLMSERSQNFLIDFVSKGGNLIILGSTGIKNQYNLLSEHIPLLDIAGLTEYPEKKFTYNYKMGKLLFLPLEIPVHKFLTTPENKSSVTTFGSSMVNVFADVPEGYTRNNMHPELRKVLEDLVSDVKQLQKDKITFIESANPFIEMTTMQNADHMLVHLVNYNVTVDGDITPGKNIKAQILIPEGSKVKTVLYSGELGKLSEINYEIKDSGSKKILLVTFPDMNIYGFARIDLE